MTDRGKALGPLGHIHRFFFSAATPWTLCLGRLLFFSGFSYFFSYYGDDLRYYAGASDMLWSPISYFSLVPRLQMSAGEAFFVATLWKISLLTSAAGFFTRTSIGACFFLSAFVIGYSYCFGDLSHNSSILLVITGILAFSHCGRFLSVDAWLNRRFTRGGDAPPARSAEYQWPVRLIQAYMALIYCAAGLSKLQAVGLRWSTRENAVAIILGSPTVNAVGIFVASHPTLAALGSSFFYFAEVCAPLALIHRGFAVVIVSGWALMHVSSTLMNQAAYVTCLPAFVFWLPLGLLVENFHESRVA